MLHRRSSRSAALLSVISVIASGLAFGAFAAPAHAGPAHAGSHHGGTHHAGGGHDHTRRASLGAGAARHVPAKSIGSPTHGQLVGGVHLPDEPYLRVVPAYSGGDVRWGLDALVGMLERSARSVRKHHPDAVLSVGHLSKRGGGEIDHHASHESGRDADIAFYVKDDKGKQILPSRFVAFTGDGKAPTMPGAHFDDARNWLLVVSLLSDPVARVSHLFVAAPLRARLLGYAERIGAPQNLRVRAAEVLMQPHGSLPHDDHFHVRIACPHGMQGCVEQPEAHASHHAAQKSAPAARAHGGHSAPAHGKAPAAPAKPAHAAPAPKQAVKDPPAPTSDDDPPRLGPPVQGLDSAVVATPIDDVDGPIFGRSLFGKGEREKNLE